MPPPPTTPRWPAPLSGSSAWSLLLSRSWAPASPFACCGEPSAQRRTPIPRAIRTPPGPLVDDLDDGGRGPGPRSSSNAQPWRRCWSPAATSRRTRTGGLRSARCQASAAPGVGRPPLVWDLRRHSVLQNAWRRGRAPSARSQANILWIEEQCRSFSWSFHRPQLNRTRPDSP